VYGLQAHQLQYHEKQEISADSLGTQEILQMVPQAHSAQGNEEIEKTPSGTDGVFCDF